MSPLHPSPRPKRALRALVVSLLSLLVAVGALQALPAQAAPTAVEEPTPFTLSRPGSSDRKVFAHYFPPYPVSLDNVQPDQDYYTRHYLNPQGENGKFLQAGGLLRDRPVGRAPRPGDYLLGDLRTEVSQASAAGIDGFTVNVMGTSGKNWEITTKLFTAARDAGNGFTVVPNVDANGSIGSATPAHVAEKLNVLFSSPSAHRLSDGRYLLSSFRAEGRPVSWWRDIMSILQQRYGKKIAFTAVFVDASSANMKAFAPISYALSDWGTRDPEGIKQRPNMVASAKALGTRWMSSVSFQDVRPSGYSYAESANSTALRLSWNEAIDDGAHMVQLISWNDYSETTSFAVSKSHGRGILDLSAWYATRFKRGSWPTVASDAIYVVHRTQPYAAKPYTSHRLADPTLGNSRTAPRDRVEVVTFLRAASAVKITVGTRTVTVQAPAGYSYRTVPLLTGKVSVTATRSGGVVETVTSPHTIQARKQVQDLQYYVASSES